MGFVVIKSHLKTLEKAFQKSLGGALRLSGVDSERIRRFLSTSEYAAFCQSFRLKLRVHRLAVATDLAILKTPTILSST